MKATIVGSILANVVLILGMAFVVGGYKHGKQTFSSEHGRNLSLMLTLAVFVLAITTLGISQAFAGLVVLQSPVQVALTIAPIVTLIAPLLGAAAFWRG